MLTVDQGFLEKLLESKTETVNGPVAMLDPVTHRKWISAVSSAIATARNQGYSFPVILCPETVRNLVKNRIERELPGIVVLSSAEITPEIKLESLGGIEIE